MRTQQPYILMLEDDGDDRQITRSFFAESTRKPAIEFLEHADEVLPYLERCNDGELPRLIILDKNVPRGSSMDALRQIKEHPTFRSIPVVIISGSVFAADVTESYRLGANSFIAKPFSNEQTVKTINTFISYWFDTVELPENERITARTS